MTQSLGAFGEAWAVGLLHRQGYTILERNVRFRAGEIDIVARDGDELVFVEVKCRRSLRHGPPESSVTARRYSHLALAVAQYLADRNLEDHPHRIDVVAIEVDHRGRVVRGEILRNVEPPA